MTFSPLGDSAVLVNLEQKIDPVINNRVIAFTDTLKATSIEGVTGCIPAYCSLTITFDPLITTYQKVKDRLEKLLGSAIETTPKDRRRVTIPVCYEEEFGLDFDELENQTGLSPNDVIDLHTKTQFQVYMLGFLPGFVYMGSLPKALICSRKTTPRLKVPARSVGLAGQQTGIYPSEAPGGWQIIGRTPLDIFDFRSDTPFLFNAGDQVVFESITSDDYHQTRELVTKGKFETAKIYG